MIGYLLIFISQLAFNTIRLIGIKHGNDGDMKESLILSLIMQTLWLTTNYLGVVSLLNKDYFGVALYLLGGLFGTYIGIKYIRIKKYKEEK